MNKILLGGVTAFLFCGIIAANSLLFPSVLAVTGESNEVQSVNVEELSALVESDDGTESEINGVNMISEKKAVELARKAVNKSEFDVDVSEFENKTLLFENVAPMDTAIWNVTFYEEIDEKNVPQKYYSVSINAKTGDTYTAIEFERFNDFSESKIGYNIRWTGISENGRSIYSTTTINENDAILFTYNIEESNIDNSDVISEYTFKCADYLVEEWQKFGILCYVQPDGSNEYCLFSPYFFTTEKSIENVE